MTTWTLVTGDFVTTGGMDRANHALASYLASQGGEVELVAHRVAPELVAHSNVTFHRVPKPLGSYFLGSLPLAWAGARAGRHSGARGGRVVVSGGNCRFPDVNWAHYVHAAYHPDLVGSGLRRLKARVQRILDLGAERAAIRVARVVVCNSERTRRDVIERVGAKPERTAVVYYGCDATRFRPAGPDERAQLRLKLGWPTSAPIAIFIGALGDRRKGFDTLFRAWQDLSRGGDWDGLLVVVGSGAELPRWERLATDAGLNRSIRFMGFRGDVPDLLRAADVLVSPTRYEAYGLGVHEALCCGLSALVSADAGVAERYPTDLAELLLPNPDDASDLAARLRRLRDDMPGSRARVRPLADRLRGYSWDDMARDFVTRCG